ISLRGLVIGAEQVLPLRHLDALLEQVIVVCRSDAQVVRVGEWEDVQERLAVLVNAVGRNDIAGKASRLISGAAIASLERITDEERYRVAIGVERDKRFREIAVAFELRRRRHLPQRLRAQRLRILERVEEEQFLLQPAPQLRQPDWSAESRAKRAVTIARFRYRGGLARQRRSGEGGVVKEIVGVEHLMAFVPVTGAVILARAGFGNDIHAGRRITGVLGLIAVEQHFDFADGVEVDLTA